MEEQAEKNVDAFEILNKCIEIFCCGSNLFGQIECINEEASNISVNTPREIVDILQELPIGSGDQAFNRNSSAKIDKKRSECKVNVCLTWDRIICHCGHTIKTIGSKQHVCQQKSVKQIVANGNITCLVTDSGISVI